jgi:hypothetical protein
VLSGESARDAGNQKQLRGQIRDSSPIVTLCEDPAKAGLLAQHQLEVPMSKLMIIFVLLASGTLYDPQRVLSHLGPDASAIGWKLKNTMPSFR